MAQINNKKRFAAVGAALAFLGAASFSVCLFVRNEDNKDNYIPSNNVMVYEPPKKLIDLTAINQYPELPTGCEVTSLAMALSYNGIDIDKCEIADKYIDKGDADGANPYFQFIGDPGDEFSFGCYAPVIVSAAEMILDEYDSSLTVTDLSGAAFENLFAYIDRGVPVMVWCTQDCREAYVNDELDLEYYDMEWISPEHCAVLVGYSENDVWIADPNYGEIMVYDKDIFNRCYDSLHKQAIVIS